MAKTVEPMTSGPVSKRMIFFALPLLLGNLFQQLYNTVDSLIVGNFLGSSALAAVSSSGSLIFMLIGFVSGIWTRCGGIDDCRGCSALSPDSGVDGNAGKRHGGVHHVLTDLFFRFDGVCHVQRFCGNPSGNRGQPPSAVLSDHFFRHEFTAGHSVYRGGSIPASAERPWLW